MSHICIFSQDQDVSRDEPILPAGQNVWKPFPSTRIPDKFTEDSVKEYFERLPRVTFSYATGVVSAPSSDTTGGAPSTFESAVLEALESEGEVDDISSDEDDENEKGGPPSDFFDLIKRAVLNCLPRGRRYMRSGNVLSVLDCSRGDFYFVKGFVQASMETDVRCATATISTKDGAIITASCSCKARALQRCGHISAVLHLLLKHIEVSGNEGSFLSIKSLRFTCMLFISTTLILTNNQLYL